MNKRELQIVEIATRQIVKRLDVTGRSERQIERLERGLHGHRALLRRRPNGRGEFMSHDTELVALEQRGPTSLGRHRKIFK